MNKKKYWAFISYSSKDVKLGRWLHRSVENYLIPKQFRDYRLFDDTRLSKKLRPVFLDRDELSGSSNLAYSIKKALNSSRFLIVICSKNSAKSKWVNKEIETFIEIGKEKYILALILDGIPNATSKGDPENECFPPALQNLKDTVVGDFRKNGDGKERGLLKIISGITQLDYSTLYKRHMKYKWRKNIIRIIKGSLWLTSSYILFFITLTLWFGISMGISEIRDERYARYYSGNVTIDNFEDTLMEVEQNKIQIKENILLENEICKKIKLDYNIFLKTLKNKNNDHNLEDLRNELLKKETYLKNLRDSY